MARRRRNDKLETLRERVAALEPGVSPLPIAAAGLVEIFDAARGGAYMVERASQGSRMSYFVDALGNCGSFFADFAALIANHPGGWGTFDYEHVPQEARDRALRVAPDIIEGLGARSPAAAGVLSRHPWLVREHQLRALICDGEELVAWLGVLRDRPFTQAEERAMQPVVDALRERLVPHRRLVRSGVAAGALEAALEAVGGPAFLMRGEVVVHANHAGQALLARAPRALEQLLRAGLSGSGGGDLKITRVPGAGGPDHHLIVAHPRPLDLDQRLEGFAQRHGLSPRQRDVLRLVVRGEANKTIAAQLECAESTVELHVTGILARTACAGRAALVARFWSERAA
ncbi:MAG: LuxR C-terminal-related transcriptional regulator [Anaeromyxobacter sp.]